MNSCFSMCNYILVNINKHNDEKKIKKEVMLQFRQMYSIG